MLCNQNMESNWHLFVDCQFAKGGWQEAGLLNFIEDKASHTWNFHDLFFSILTSASSMIG